MESAPGGPGMEKSRPAPGKRVKTVAETRFRKSLGYIEQKSVPWLLGARVPSLWMLPDTYLY